MREIISMILSAATLHEITNKILRDTAFVFRRSLSPLVSVANIQKQEKRPSKIDWAATGKMVLIGSLPI
jgi:hypothetical protein